jgi:hypothetical protein
MDSSQNKEMFEVLEMQKSEANNNFSKFIVENYESWLHEPDEDRPILSHQLMKKKIFPEIDGKTPVFFILIDNLRYDQWKIIEPLIEEYFNIEKEESYYSILPTTTAYSRNAIFSGMMPLEMEKYHSDLWIGEDLEEGKNLHEAAFLERQFKRNRLNIKHSYNKILNIAQGKQLADSINNLLTNDINVIVYNFVDILSHSRTEMEVIRELAPNESAYRSLTRSWFSYSPLLEILITLAKNKVKVLISTDHGTIRVKRPFRIVGDRNTNTNLRYKVGKNLSFEDEKVYVMRKPENLFLPKVNVSSTYVFSVEDYFFAYPNNYNYYVKYYSDTFQHGGISMEEMIIPIISLTSKKL